MDFFFLDNNPYGFLLPINEGNANPNHQYLYLGKKKKKSNEPIIYRIASLVTAKVSYPDPPMRMTKDLS